MKDPTVLYITFLVLVIIIIIIINHHSEKYINANTKEGFTPCDVDIMNAFVGLPGFSTSSVGLACVIC